MEDKEIKKEQEEKKVEIKISTEGKIQKYFSMGKKIFLSILGLAATFLIYLNLSRKDSLKENKKKIKENLKEIDKLKTDIFLKDKQIEAEKKELEERNKKYEEERSNIEKELASKIKNIQDDKTDFEKNVEYFKNRYGSKEDILDDKE